MPDIGMIISQLARLGGNGFGNFLAAIAHVHAIKPGKGIQPALAFAVGDMAALAAGDHAMGQIATGEFCQMCRGVKKVFPVPLGQMIVLQHDSTHDRRRAALC